MKGASILKTVFGTFLDKLIKLMEVKNLVILIMTVALVLLIFHSGNVKSEVLALFSGAYGIVITYFFTRKAD